jgi:hypothetical protein
MKKAANALWTEEDIEKLRAMVTKGKSVFRVAASFGRSVSAIRACAQRNGIKLRKAKDGSAQVARPHAGDSAPAE